jgi:hypothetical protein
VSEHDVKRLAITHAERSRALAISVNTRIVQVFAPCLTGLTKSTDVVHRPAFRTTAYQRSLTPLQKQTIGCKAYKPPTVALNMWNRNKRSWFTFGTVRMLQIFYATLLEASRARMRGGMICCTVDGSVIYILFCILDIEMSGLGRALPRHRVVRRNSVGLGTWHANKCFGHQQARNLLFASRLLPRGRA